MLAGWRVSLRRTRADWPIVAAAGLITLLAAVLLAAGPMYASAAARGRPSSGAGRRPRRGRQRRSLAVRRGRQASPRSTNGVLAELAAAPGAHRRADRPGVGLQREHRAPGRSPARKRAIRPSSGTSTALAEHATLVSGAWPADRGGPGEPVQAVVAEALAVSLGLEVGDELALTARPPGDPVDVPLQVVGIFSITTATDPFWNADAQLLDGRVANSSYTTFGPFLTTATDLRSDRRPHVGANGVAHVRRLPEPHRRRRRDPPRPPQRAWGAARRECRRARDGRHRAARRCSKARSARSS